jgi:hypothetical protein
MTTTRTTPDNRKPRNETQADRSICGAITALESVERDLTRFHPELITPIRFARIRQMMIRLVRNHARILKLLAKQLRYARYLEQRIEQLEATCHD